MSRDTVRAVGHSGRASLVAVAGLATVDMITMSMEEDARTVRKEAVALGGLHWTVPLLLRPWVCQTFCLSGKIKCKWCIIAKGDANALGPSVG